jgi:AcrR family transcriptional regulator
MNNSVILKFMPRPSAAVTQKRLADLSQAAFTVFSTQGFERAQMADVAKSMGVAVGTIYLYVESKDALFDLVVRSTAITEQDWLQKCALPIRTPAPGSTISFLSEIFSRRGQWPCLEAALAQPQATDPEAELRGIITEQYQLMAIHRRGLVLLSRCALDFPGLLETFVLGLRATLLTYLDAYLRSRILSGQFHPHANPYAVAAMITQTIAWANLQRPSDPGFAHLDDATIADSTITMLVRGVLTRA